jgi:hypothetical protein
MNMSLGGKPPRALWPGWSSLALEVGLWLALPVAPARAEIDVIVTTPASAAPCDSLSVTSRVANIGNTLDQLQVSQFLPVAAYRYVTNSLRIVQPDGIVTTTLQTSPAIPCP